MTQVMQQPVNILKQLLGPNIEYYLLTNIDPYRPYIDEFYCLTIRVAAIELLEENSTSRNLYIYDFLSQELCVNSNVVGMDFLVDFTMRLKRVIHDISNQSIYMFEKLKQRSASESVVEGENLNRVKQELDDVQKHIVINSIRQLSMEELEQVTGGVGAVLLGGHVPSKLRDMVKAPGLFSRITHLLTRKRIVKNQDLQGLQPIELNQHPRIQRSLSDLASNLDSISGLSSAKQAPVHCELPILVNSNRLEHTDVLIKECRSLSSADNPRPKSVRNLMVRMDKELLRLTKRVDANHGEKRTQYINLRRNLEKTKEEFIGRYVPKPTSAGVKDVLNFDLLEKLIKPDSSFRPSTAHKQAFEELKEMFDNVGCVPFLNETYKGRRKSEYVNWLKDGVLSCQRYQSAYPTGSPRAQLIAKLEYNIMAYLVENAPSTITEILDSYQFFPQEEAEALLPQKIEMLIQKKLIRKSKQAELILGQLQGFSAKAYLDTFKVLRTHNMESTIILQDFFSHSLRSMQHSVPDVMQEPYEAYCINPSELKKGGALDRDPFVNQLVKQYVGANVLEAIPDADPSLFNILESMNADKDFIKKCLCLGLMHYYQTAREMNDSDVMKSVKLLMYMGFLRVESEKGLALIDAFGKDAEKIFAPIKISQKLSERLAKLPEPQIEMDVKAYCRREYKKLSELEKLRKAEADAEKKADFDDQVNRVKRLLFLKHIRYFEAHFQIRHSHGLQRNDLVNTMNMDLRDIWEEPMNWHQSSIDFSRNIPISDYVLPSGKRIKGKDQTTESLLLQLGRTVLNDSQEKALGRMIRKQPVTDQNVEAYVQGHFEGTHLEHMFRLLNQTTFSSVMTYLFSDIREAGLLPTEVSKAQTITLSEKGVTLVLSQYIESSTPEAYANLEGAQRPKADLSFMAQSTFTFTYGNSEPHVSTTLSDVRVEGLKEQNQKEVEERLFKWTHI